MWPLVCPGVGTGTGRPGRSRGSARAVAVGTATFRSAPEPDGVDRPREHPRSPGVAGDLGGTRLLDDLAPRVADLGRPGEHREADTRGQRGEPADVVDVGVGDQCGCDVARPAAHRGEGRLQRSGVAG